MSTLRSAAHIKQQLLEAMSSGSRFEDINRALGALFKHMRTGSLLQDMLEGRAESATKEACQYRQVAVALAADVDVLEQAGTYV